MKELTTFTYPLGIECYNKLFHSSTRPQLDLLQDSVEPCCLDCFLHGNVEQK